MELKNKSNQCSFLFSIGIFFTLYQHSYKAFTFSMFFENPKMNLICTFFFSSSLRCNKLVPERMAFFQLAKWWKNLVVILQHHNQRSNINNNDTKKVNQHCIKTLFTFLKTSSFSLFFSSNEKNLCSFQRGRRRLRFFSFFFVCFVYSIIHNHNSFSTIAKKICMYTKAPAEDKINRSVQLLFPFFFHLLFMY